MRRYVFPAFVERVPSGGYSLFFEDLPGCVTGADDLPGLAAMAREALQLHLAGMAEDGDPIPEPTPLEKLTADPEFDIVATLLVEASLDGPPTAIVVSLPQALLARVDALAQARGTTRDEVLSQSAEEALLRAS